jgi:hypothetical protein
MNDQRKCEILLESHEKGYSILRSLKLSLKIYMLLMFALTLATVLSYKYLNHYLAYWIIGMTMGTIIRDIGWFRRIKQNWPLTARITNWDVVKGIAENKES